MLRIALSLLITALPVTLCAETYGANVPWRDSPFNVKNADHANRITTFENSPANPDNSPTSAKRINFEIAEFTLFGITFTKTTGYATEGKIVNLYTDRTSSDPAKRIGYCIRNTNYHSKDGTPNRSLRENLAIVPPKTEVKFDPLYFSCRLVPGAEQVIPVFTSNR